MGYTTEADMSMADNEGVRLKERSCTAQRAPNTELFVTWGPAISGRRRGLGEIAATTSTRFLVRTSNA